jgi:hypothetical protein
VASHAHLRLLFMASSQCNPAKPSCTLQDVMMPQVDGLDVLRFVRSHELLSSLPVISKCLLVGQLHVHSSPPPPSSSHLGLASLALQ